eukprot:scaffold23993_cov144-Skeletonema_dohrnii-CCMP3373.AAC.2
METRPDDCHLQQLYITAQTGEEGTTRFDRRLPQLQLLRKNYIHSMNMKWVVHQMSKLFALIALLLLAERCRHSSIARVIGLLPSLHWHYQGLSGGSASCNTVGRYGHEQRHVAVN